MLAPEGMALPSLRAAQELQGHLEVPGASSTAQQMRRDLGAKGQNQASRGEAEAQTPELPSWGLTRRAITKLRVGSSQARHSEDNGIECVSVNAQLYLF